MSRTSFLQAFFFLNVISLYITASCIFTCGEYFAFLYLKSTFSLLYHSIYLSRGSLSILYKPPSNSYFSLVGYSDLLILCFNKIPLLHCLLLMEFEQGGWCGLMVSPSPHHHSSDCLVLTSPFVGTERPM